MSPKPKYHFFHYLIVAADLFGSLPAPALALMLAALSALTGWTWVTRTGDAVTGMAAGAGLLAFMAGDWLMLAWLPRAGRSFGPVGAPLMGLALVRWGLTTAAALIPNVAALPYGWAALAVIGHLALTGAALDSLWAEPFRLGVTRLELKSDKLAGQPPLRVLHLSDLHIERITLREQRLLELACALRPDLIVFTGDFLNLSFTHDERALADCRSVLAQLSAPLGVYAISGSPTVDPLPVVEKILDGLNMRWLNNKAVSVRMTPEAEPALAIVGVTCTNDAQRDGQTFERVLSSVPRNPATPFTLLLYHMPDLMPQAARANIDLYLCGHTHGGQVRLPLFGAVITNSRFWKRYEMGYYVKGNTRLYVSRGLGMEGRGAPRARFQCPPEIELFELRGE
jgi:predicted MPP superfamily phosphohydrolase